MSDDIFVSRSPHTPDRRCLYSDDDQSVYKRRKFHFEDESYEEISPASSSNKAVKHMRIDRLSALPDSLLIHILSFLDIWEAVMTSVLSKRWQFIWSYLPSMEFTESRSETEEIRKFVAWVHRALLISGGNQLKTFAVDFTYDKSFASDVNIWVEFVVKNKVEDVSFMLVSKIPCKNLYVLPQILYSNSSLTCLRLEGCIVAPRRAIEWGSLTTLHLLQLELPGHVMDKILSGCPVLDELILTECWGLNCLEVDSQSLRAVHIEYFKDWNREPLLEMTAPNNQATPPLLEMTAPFIHSMQLHLYPEGTKLWLKNISSVVRANIDFTSFDRDAASSVRVTNYTKELFEDIQHVEKLELGQGCIEALSALVQKGFWLPQSRRKDLTIYGLRDKQSIPGILVLLESSPDLETLSIIRNYNPSQDSFTGTPAASYLKKVHLKYDLSHLKTVSIKNFTDSDLASEPMLTLMQLLLKKATVLEKMVIDVEESTAVSSRYASGDSIKLAHTLLSYPRSSQKAVILLH